MTFFDVGIHLFNIFVLVIIVLVSAALLVLIFMVLIKANKLLHLKIDKAERDYDQPTKMQ
jgi:hypothetical protein